MYISTQSLIDIVAAAVFIGIIVGALAYKLMGRK